MAITFDPTTPAPLLTTVTITADGLTAAGAVYLAVNAPSGNSTVIETVADGGGEATMLYIPQEVGTYTVASYDGPTTQVDKQLFPSDVANVDEATFTAVGG